MRTHFNEKILIYKVRKGDADSFGPIFDHYNEKIYRFVYLKVPTAQDAEDITAETFLRAWQHLKEQKNVTSLQAFLYQIARNLVIDFYRKRGTVIESIDDQDIVIADRVDLTLEEKVMLKSDMQDIETGLRQLKDAYREIIVLYYLNELSLKEIAKIIDRSPGAARVILHRGMKSLKEILAKPKEKK